MPDPNAANPAPTGRPRYAERYHMFCNYRHVGCPFFIRLLTDKAFEQRDQMLAHVVSCPYRTISEPETGERLALGELDDFRKHRDSKSLRRAHRATSPTKKCTCCNHVQHETDIMDSRISSMLRDSQIKPRQAALRHNVEMAHTVRQAMEDIQEVKRKRERAQKVARALEEQLLEEQRKAQDGFTAQMLQELVGLRKECSELRSQLNRDM